MNTPELKNILISKISQIDDAEFLLAIKIILDTKNSTLTHKDYEEYNHEILKAEEDIKNTIADYVKGAKNSLDAGFDGIEINPH